jgi:hypothetical protein
MKKIDFLIRSLYDKNLTAKQLTDLYYEKCQDDIDKKRQYYIDKGIEKTEKQLRNQIYAEIGSTFYDNKNKIYTYFNISNDRPHLYSLTEEGKAKYGELLEDVEEIYLDEPILIEEPKGNNDDIGIVYLLKSKIHADTYKIGMTNRTVEERLYDLQRDRTYGSYILEPLIHVKLKNYSLVEQVCHKYFENFRLCKRNDLFIDTELFKTDVNLLNEFKYFLRVNFLEHQRLIKDVLEYKEY